MWNGKTYTEAEIQNTEPGLIELLSRQFFGNSPKIANQLFFKKLFRWLLQTYKVFDISFKSAP